MAERGDGPSRAAHSARSEDDVREVVSRVVDAVLAAGSTDQSSPPSPITPTAPTTTAPAPAVAAASFGSGTIAVGADHGGFALKNLIAETLRGYGYQVTDCGTNSADAVDYPDFADAVARLVAAGTCSAGIVVDGAGIGSCMAANKVPGIRAALCYDISTARNSREHNHANVLTLGARLIGDGLALEIVKTWLGTPWGGGRHGARVDKITEIERRYMRSAPGEAR
jgi:ribose 5-phosphate isomerase B